MEMLFYLDFDLFFSGWSMQMIAETGHCTHCWSTSTGLWRGSAVCVTYTSAGEVHIQTYTMALACLTFYRLIISCLIFTRWITTNDRLAPMDPCLFCDKCFRMLHYDDQGNKLYDFQAYVYVDPGVFNWASDSSVTLFTYDLIMFMWKGHMHA